jgi:hypothetical protein
MYLEAYDFAVRVACLILALWFVIAFSRVRWKETLEGRHIMWFTRMIACFMSLPILYRLFPQYHDIYVWVSRVFFIWCAYLLWQRVQLQRAAQRENDSDSDTPELNTPSEPEWERNTNGN